MNVARAILDAATSERDWQAVVVGMARACGWVVFHVYDSRRSEPGFPDLVLVRERVVFAELKTEHGRMSPWQYEWIAALRAAGAEVYVWRPSDVAAVEQVLRRRET